MWYEQRDTIVLKLIKFIEDNITHRELTDEEGDGFLSLFEELIDPYTEGDWYNYN